MPLGLNSFSFDLFGISRRVIDPTPQAPSQKVEAAVSHDPKEEDRRDGDRTELNEWSFRGLGFFPVF